MVNSVLKALAGCKRERVESFIVGRQLIERFQVSATFLAVLFCHSWDFLPLLTVNSLKIFLLEDKIIQFSLAYTMRNVLNIAITEMVYKEAHNATIRDNTCPSSSGGITAEREGFHWSEQLQGIILGAFFWGYVRI